MKGRGNIRLAISIIAIAIVLGVSVMGASDAYANDIWVSAYYAGWMQKCGSIGPLPADKIDYSALTHIIHFAIIPKHDGTIDSSGNCILPENSSSLVTYARAAGKKVLISIGGSQTESAFLSATNNTNRQKFINNLVNFMVSRSYDGIDFDWEPISPSSVTQVKTFVTELRAALDAITPRPLLTAAVFYEPALFAQLQDKFDQINIMTYDISATWTGYSWFNAPTYDGGYWFPQSGPPPSANGLVDTFIAAGAKREKLGIGLAFYGYVWKGGTGTPTGGVTAPNQKWTTMPSINYYTIYADIMDNFFQPAYYRYDAAAGASYLSIDKAGSADDMFISYNDETTAFEKVKYVRSKGIGGIMIFELGGGWRPNAPVKDSLLQSVKSAVIQTQPPTQNTVPSSPALNSPSNGATGVPVSTALSWNASSGANSYTLQVSVNSAFTALVVNQANITAASHNISGLNNSSVYYWRVMAVNASGNSGWSSVWSFNTITATTAAASTVIANFTGSPVSNGALLTWQTTSESNNKGFDIERKFSTSSRWVKMSYVAGAGTSTVTKNYSNTDTSTRKNRTYNYRLKQINTDGSFTYSSVVTVKK